MFISFLINYKNSSPFLCLVKLVKGLEAAFVFTLHVHALDRGDGVRVTDII